MYFFTLCLAKQLPPLPEAGGGGSEELRNMLLFVQEGFQAFANQAELKGVFQPGDGVEGEIGLPAEDGRYVLLRAVNPLGQLLLRHVQLRHPGSCQQGNHPRQALPGGMTRTYQYAFA